GPLYQRRGGRADAHARHRSPREALATGTAGARAQGRALRLLRAARRLQPSRGRLPARHRRLMDYLAAYAAKHGDAVALIEGEHRLTWAEERERGKARPFSLGARGV